jgi:hypothetical protein
MICTKNLATTDKFSKSSITPKKSIKNEAIIMPIICGDKLQARKELPKQARIKDNPILMPPISGIPCGIKNLYFKANFLNKKINNIPTKKAPKATKK